MACSHKILKKCFFRAKSCKMNLLRQTIITISTPPNNKVLNLYPKVEIVNFLKRHLCYQQGCPDMCIHGYSEYKDSGIRADAGWIQIFIGMDTGYRIGYKFFQSGYMIPDWIHKIFQNLESNSKIKFSDYRSIIM